MTVVDDLLNKYLVEDHNHNHQHRNLDDEDSSSTTTETMTAKAVAMCVLFLASLALGLTPLKLSTLLNWDKNPKHNKLVVLLLCFGGGVLLCTTFLHLLPEVTEHIEQLQEEGTLPDLKLHLAPTLMCLGFFTMYFVEECVHYYLHRRQKSNNNDLTAALRRSLSIRRGELEEKTSTNNLVKLESQSCDEHLGHSHLVFEDSFSNSLRGFLVVLALSVHELFEGLAVGLESSASTVWYMFGAVSAHKLVIAFCIGVELVTTGTRTLLIVVYVFTFAVVSPLGIGIGMVISGDAESQTDVASAILQGLASGTLLYVVFFEILQKDMKGGLRPFVAVLVGFAVMFGITLLGIGFGIALSTTGGSDIDVTSVILQGMAAGTLLYVVFFEVLARERSNRHGGGLWKLVAILAGFLVMLSLQVATGHEHSHGHSHDDHDHSVEVTTAHNHDHTHAY